MKILITGASGNVGLELIKSLSTINHRHEIYAGVRDLDTKEAALEALNGIKRQEFDFDKTDQFESYLNGIEGLFLLRPPHISNVTKYFQPLIDAAKKVGVQYIVFLSVQGVERSSSIPHHKIEKLIVQSGINYTFLRPAYFMQNFTTTLRNDLVEKNSVFLPAGNALFNLIDVKDVGEVAAIILVNSSAHKNKAYELTNAEQLDFESMCATLSATIERKIRFVSPNLLRFFLQKRKEQMAIPFILVMIMLHFLPRFQHTLPMTDWVKKLLGREPTSFQEFVKRERSVWIN